MSFRYDRQHLTGQQKAIAASRDRVDEELRKQPKKKTCPTCGGSKNIPNEEWERAWDRYDSIYPTMDLVNAKMKDSGIPESITCPVCKGEGEIKAD